MVRDGQEDKERRYTEAFHSLRGVLSWVPDPYARAPLHEMLNDLYEGALESLQAGPAPIVEDPATSNTSPETGESGAAYDAEQATHE